MRRCRRRVRRPLRCRIQVVAVARRTSTPPRMAAAPRSTSCFEKPGPRAGLFVELRLQFKTVLREQISLIVRCLLKAVSIHSGQRGTGG